MTSGVTFTIGQKDRDRLMQILGHGVYGLPEAAKLTRLNAHRVREWFRERPRNEPRRPVFRSDYRPVGGDRAISFHDLIELKIAGQLRDQGVSLQSLRKVHSQLQSELNTRHPFCRKEVLTDGKRVFTLGLDAENQAEMVEVLTHQKVFAEILLPFL
jgi:DNA-binding transcriptional MerR regulator